MSDTIRLTCAQALVRYLAALRARDADEEASHPLFAGVFAIFGHGNVAGLGEALQGAGDALPTYRAHNEQGMAHAAIAFAKQLRRRRAMVCTSDTSAAGSSVQSAKNTAYPAARARACTPRSTPV